MCINQVRIIQYNTTKTFSDFEIWDSSYPGWDASENAWLSGNNVSQSICIRINGQGATGAMGKTGHGNYWRGWDRLKIINY